MKKILIALLLFVLLSALASAITVRSWMHTPHGTLTAASAIISHLATWQEASTVGNDMASLRASRRKAMPLMSTPGPALAEVSERSIKGLHGAIPLRIFRPSVTPPALPVIVFFHGGGWVLGDLDSHDNVCRQLALKTGALVVAVDYRLAPEHRYPAAVDDAYAAVRWVAEEIAMLGGDPTRIAVAGDSAGGNLAAAVTLLARDRGGPTLTAQALIYPAVDLANLTRPSMRDFAQGFFLTRARMDWFFDQYIPDPADRRLALASPLLASDHRALPPALILTAQFDPLRDEGTDYAEALRRAGVSTELERVDGVIHGFISMDRWFPESTLATDRIAAFLKARFTRTS